MSKQKKITVKHYLNTRLKPTIEDNILEYPIYISITYDRMNLRIPSNIIWNCSIEDFKEKNLYFNGLSKMEYENDLIKRCVEIFKNDEDLKKLRKDFYLLYPLKKYRSNNERIKIFSSYIDYYRHSIYDVVSLNLLEKIKNSLFDKLKVSDLKNNTDSNINLLFSPNNPELYKLITKYKLGLKIELYYILWSRFHSYLAFQGSNFGYDMPYIDWLQKKGQPIFIKFLKVHERTITDNWDDDFLTKERINLMINEIENIIFDNNYFQKLINQ